MRREEEKVDGGERETERERDVVAFRWELSYQRKQIQSYIRSQIN